MVKIVFRLFRNCDLNNETHGARGAVSSSQRLTRQMSDTKSGKRREAAARTSWQTACDLGFRGSLGEWERLMGATAKR